jgi:hypothetical protein
MLAILRYVQRHTGNLYHWNPHHSGADIYILHQFPSAFGRSQRSSAFLKHPHSLSWQFSFLLAFAILAHLLLRAFRLFSKRLGIYSSAFLYDCAWVALGIYIKRPTFFDIFPQHHAVYTTPWTLLEGGHQLSREFWIETKSTQSTRYCMFPSLKAPKLPFGHADLFRVRHSISNKDLRSISLDTLRMSKTSPATMASKK